MADGPSFNAPPPAEGRTAPPVIVRAGERLAVSCLFCRHFVWMAPPEIAELAKRLGDDFATPDLPRRLKCSKCGSRRVDVRRSHAG